MALKAPVVLEECLAGGGVRAENRVAASTPPEVRQKTLQKRIVQLASFLID
jgi:hypothetical protein